VFNIRHKRARARRSTVGCETLETRTVMSYGGPSSLLGSLSYVGVVTTPIESTSMPVVPMPVIPNPVVPSWLRGPASPYGGLSIDLAGIQKLRKDLQTLETELQALAAKSGLTIGDLENLTNDSQAIAQAGFSFQASTLNPVISELAVAVAGGTSTGQAQTDFTGLFSGSSVSSMTITSTFGDLVKAIGDSAVTTTDLSTVAADEAAIQSDLPTLPSPVFPAGQAWLDEVGSTPAAISVASPVTNPTPAIASPILPIGPVGPVLPQPIIISPFGGFSLLGSLSSVGVVTSPVFVAPTTVVPVPVSVPPTISIPPMQSALAAVTGLPNIPATSSGAWAQLQADVQKLQTELQSLAEKSGLTIADLQSLTNDAQTISQAGFFFNVQSLNKTVSELATAVAGGASTAGAQTDFTALFSGSSVSTTTINTAFADLTKAIQDSAVLPGDLTTVAADQAAIQADLKNLFPGITGGSGTGTTGTGTGGTTGTGTGGTTGTGTGGTTGTGTGGTTGTGTGGTTGTGTGTGGTTGTGTTGDQGGHKKPAGHHKGHAAEHIVVIKKVKPAAHATKLSRLKKH
jgi:hypothetical protein